MYPLIVTGSSWLLGPLIDDHAFEVEQVPDRHVLGTDPGPEHVARAATTRIPTAGRIHVYALSRSNEEERRTR